MPLKDARLLPDLPPLAWLTEVKGKDIRLYCGDHVEFADDWFFEGCWAGEFEQLNFDRATNVFGSGARLRDDRISFVTPSHTLEALYVFEGGETFCVSNSLAFLATFTDTAPQFDFDIGLRLASVIKGIDGYERFLLTETGKSTDSRMKGSR